MAYKILDDKGEVKLHDGKEVMGADLILTAEEHGELTKGLSVDEEQRIVEVPISSDRQDRDGDRVDQKGGDHTNARSVLYAHDYGYQFLPIGKILGQRIAKVGDMKVTVEKHQFNPAGDYPLSDAAWKLVKFGALNSTSIGFIGRSFTRAESDKERQDLGLGPHGVLFNAWEHLETSWVPVGSNRDAFRDAFGKGIIDRSDRAVLFPDTWDKVAKPEHWAMKTAFDDDGKVIESPDIEARLKELELKLAALQEALKKQPEPTPPPAGIDPEEVKAAFAAMEQTRTEAEALKQALESMPGRIAERVAKAAGAVVNRKLGKLDPEKLNWKRRTQ